jgi:hypothetical protein
VLDVGLRGLEDAERSDVGGAFGQHDVARVQEESGDQVERLLAADGDHDIIRRGATGGVDAGVGHHLTDPLAQLRGALAEAVLQGGGAVFGGDPAQHLADSVQRKR